MRGRRIPTVVVGVASPSFPCARQFGVMHSRMKGGATITDGRKCQRGISEGEFHHIYMRGRRIPTVVVGVASSSFPCARHFGVMHTGTNGGATITNGRNNYKGVSTIYNGNRRKEESRLLLWGSLLLRSRVLDILV